MNYLISLWRWIVKVSRLGNKPQLVKVNNKPMLVTYSDDIYDKIDRESKIGTIFTTKR